MPAHSTAVNRPPQHLESLQRRHLHVFAHLQRLLLSCEPDFGGRCRLPTCPHCPSLSGPAQSRHGRLSCPAGTAARQGRRRHPSRLRCPLPRAVSLAVAPPLLLCSMQVATLLRAQLQPSCQARHHGRPCLAAQRCCLMQMLQVWGERGGELTAWLDRAGLRWSSSHGCGSGDSPTQGPTQPCSPAAAALPLRQVFSRAACSKHKHSIAGWAGLPPPAGRGRRLSDSPAVAAWSSSILEWSLRTWEKLAMACRAVCRTSATLSTARGATAGRILVAASVAECRCAVASIACNQQRPSWRLPPP